VTCTIDKEKKYGISLNSFTRSRVEFNLTTADFGSNFKYAKESLIIKNNKFGKHEINLRLLYMNPQYSDHLVHLYLLHGTHLTWVALF
jgi:hypothetical protein